MMHVWIVWRDDVPDRTEASSFVFPSQTQAKAFMDAQTEGFYLSRKVPLDPAAFDDVRGVDDVEPMLSGFFARLNQKVS